MFEYDDNSQEVIDGEEEQVVLPKAKSKAQTQTKKQTKLKPTPSKKPEPQPESDSESNSDTDSSSKSSSEKKSQDEKFMDGSNFDDFVQNDDQVQVQAQVQKDEDVVLSADDIEELRELLKNWLELDEANKELSDRMKDIKMEKKQYESYILGFMDKTKKEIIKASDSNLVLRKEVKETRSKPNEENILKVLTRVLGDATQAYKFTQEIIEDAPIKETISLKKDSAKPKKAAQPKRTTKRTKKDI